MPRSRQLVEPLNCRPDVAQSLPWTAVWQPAEIRRADLIKASIHGELVAHSGQVRIEARRCDGCDGRHHPLIDRVREQVRTQIEAGRSDQEILDYMSDRYGDFVLYKPPLERKTIVLWVGPFLILLLAAFIAWRSGRRTAKSEPSAPDQERLRRLLERENP